jgi:hypothetical protein
MDTESYVTYLVIAEYKLRSVALSINRTIEFSKASSSLARIIPGAANILTKHV